MGDETHVRLVDAHAEGHRGDDDHAVVAQKPRLMGRPLFSRQAGVVGQRVVAFAAQEFRDGLGLAPRQAIDDAGVAAALVEEAQ